MNDLDYFYGVWLHFSQSRKGSFIKQFARSPIQPEQFQNQNPLSQRKIGLLRRQDFHQFGNDDGLTTHPRMFKVRGLHEKHPQAIEVFGQLFVRLCDLDAR